LVYLIIALVILADQLTKWLAAVTLAPSGAVPLIPGALYLSYHTNTGAAWGILRDARWVFLTLSTVAIIAILVYLIYSKARPRSIAIPLALICGGGVGNMIDRVVKGEVTDFFQFNIRIFPFIFNVADVFITCGTAVFLIYYILDDRKKDKQS